MGSIAPLKIAVLINSPPGNEFWNDVKKAYDDAFHSVASDAQIDCYDPVFDANFPDPGKYDFIVLSGGKADSSSSEPWVLGVLDFVRNTARDFPKVKMLGICWGHQAIQRALGGIVHAVPTGPIAAIQDTKLTPEGKDFFRFAPGTESYRAPEFHVREVAKPAPNFIHLAEGHECFVNEANTILTFQAHPEIHNALAKKMFADEDDVYTGNSSKEQIAKEIEKLDKPMDGRLLLERIVEWARK
ncbi:uncharacterized protein ASPGLDRAFT_146705 [Aspergillus glaucus CBS 516.65]|uniref:Glutamine amidotransferase domain-containing protein n=1 Tax=Aspergillus glaucus CBS 516.65 TaxID=1160497 RepID=A0A1L9VNG5_ASPGL|nr:hypothetical protein ASPGLDRAFT_146705 [Aspergillus glaucus CBS 516.65]OJJ85434.1 hypothetical protein ASPGLDRAFT_146705 [Aspergillus glaucus CBS 516.65]